MTQLSEKCVEEFRQLVLQKHGVLLPMEEAGSMAWSTLELFRLIFESKTEVVNEKNGQKKSPHTDNASVVG